MNAIIAHFDGKVFVPDEPVVFEPGAAVIVTRTEPSLPPSNTDFLRPVLFPLDHEASQKFIDDPETNLENY